MGRKTDVLLRGFRAAKCLGHLKLVTARIKVHKNKRSISAKQMRGEIAQLLKSGQEAHVYITKADALIKQENMVAVYTLIDQYCHAIINRFPMIEMQRNCPIDMKEPIASIIFAAPRCVELSELASIKEAFTAKYGKDFAAAASELRSDCGVNKQIIELLSIRPASGQIKLKIMKEICEEYNVQWTPAEALLESSTSQPVGASQQHVEAKVGTKANFVEAASLRVGEAGPSNSDTNTQLQGGSKHAESKKLGLAAVESLKTGDGAKFVTSASKTSDTKPSSFSKEDVGKTNASVLQSLQGLMNTGTSSAKFGLSAAESLKTGGGVLATDASKIHYMSHNSFVEEDEGRANASVLQSLEGVTNTGTSKIIIGSFNESQGKPEVKAEVNVEPVVDTQDGMSDSDNDSFVSVEEGRLEDDVELSAVGAATSESFAKIPLQAFVEADANGSSLSKKPSKEIRKSSSSIESSHEDVYSRASSKNNLNTEALLEEKSFSTDIRKSSLSEKELVEVQSFKEIQEDILTKKVAEVVSFEDSEEEGLQSKDILEDVSSGATTESSGMQKLVKEYCFEASQNKMTTEERNDEEILQSKGIIEDTPFVEATESLVMAKLVEEYPFEASQNKITTEEMSSLPTSEMQNIESFSGRISGEEMSSGAGEEACLSNEKFPESLVGQMNGVPGAEASLNMETSPGIVNNQMDGVPAVEKKVQNLLGASSPGALATSGYSHDFASTAKAIAAEAARLAVLDYAKRIAGSSSIPIDVGDLTKFGVVFEENTEGSHVGRILSSEGKSVSIDSQEVGYEGDSMNARKDVDEEQKASKMETFVYDDKGSKSNHASVDETGYIWDAAKEMSLHIKTPVANHKDNHDDVNLHSMGHAWTTPKDELKQEEMTIGNDNINPFATEIATKVDKDVKPHFSKTGEGENLSSVVLTKPGLMSKGGGFGQEEDHLDIFFRRKTPWMHEEKPRFDEDRYSFVNVEASFIKDEAPYHSFDNKESSQDNFVSKAVFDHLPETQSTFSEENSSSFKIPVFDVGDEGPEPYDASFSFDDGLDKSTLSFGLPDRKGLQSPPNSKSPDIKAPPSFDLEPGPRFDKLVDEEEQFSMEKKESTQSQLRWQSKTSVKATGERLGSSTSDASPGGASIPMSRRSRKPIQRIDDYEYESKMQDEVQSAANGGSSSQLTSKRPIGSFNSLMQQQQKEQGRKDEDNVTGKKNLRTRPGESFAYKSDAMNKRPSSSPKRVSSQQDHDPSEESQLDRWDSTSSIAGSRLPSFRTKKSPTRLAQQQKVALEESDEEYYFAVEEHQVGSSSAGNSMRRRTTRVGKQQLAAQGHDEVQDDAEGYKLSAKQSELFQQDLFEDDSNEEIQARYKTDTQTDDLGRRTSASSGTYSQQQQHRRLGEHHNLESGYKQYGQIGDVGKSIPSSQLPAGQKHQDLASGYKPFVQVDGLVKSSPSRPPSSRQQQKKHIEEKGPALASKLNPNAQVDDLGRVTSSQNWSQQQRRQEEQKEVLMEQQYEQEQEEEGFHSRPLPDWRQEQRRKEKQHISTPLYGRQQELKLEKQSSELSMEECEEQQGEQGWPSLLFQQQQGGQEKQRRPLLTHGRRKESKLENENPENWQQEQIRQEQRQPIPRRRQQHGLVEEEVVNFQQPISGRQRQQSLAEEEAENQQQEHRGREKQSLPSLFYGRQQEIQVEKDSSELSMEQDELQQQERHRHSTPWREGQQEQVELVTEHRPWPLYSSRQELKLEKQNSESWEQQEGRWEQQDTLISGRQQQSQTKEEVVKGQKEKPDIKSPPPARRPPSLPAEPSSPPLESSVSDPIMLSMIPPPVKKAVVPPAAAETKLGTSISAPPLSSVPEGKGSKLPQKPPSVDDLAANFEALRRARKGE